MLGKSSKQVPVTYDGREAVTKDIPKGRLAIKVGQGKEQQRITVPVNYLNHPLFVQLLKEAEEEYGFSHKGTITIPCHVAEFNNVQHLIHCERCGWLYQLQLKIDILANKSLFKITFVYGGIGVGRSQVQFIVFHTDEDGIRSKVMDSCNEKDMDSVVEEILHLHFMG
ncbi:hypothetical protein VNO77_18709 [Canavalia gladiata]|uniref:Uncharacterized protein n=1 Tax=Canavalia gladiata TaxID=3824 RepID=A0AAN9LL79_CANGL